MPGFLLHLGVQMTCTHAAPAKAPPAQPRVVTGVPPLPVQTMASLIAVTGCPFQIPFGVGTKPQPCVRVQWTMPATRVLIAGSPPMLQPTPGPGPGTCLSVEQIPQGPPIVAGLQIRVVAT